MKALRISGISSAWRIKAFSLTRSQIELEIELNALSISHGMN